MPPRCHKHKHCRPAPYLLWLVIYPACGGEKIAGGSTDAHCWADSDACAKALIARLVQEHRLTGDFVATWRHCYGQEKPHMTPFTAVFEPVPIAVQFTC
jgi:hypothetical protein